MATPGIIGPDRKGPGQKRAKYQIIDFHEYNYSSGTKNASMNVVFLFFI